MTKVNDQVLTAIGFSLGQTEQIPPGILLDSLQPVLQADLYRRNFEVLNFSGVSSANPGNFLAFFDPGDRFSWLISTASMIWGGADFLETQITVIDRTGRFNRVGAAELAGGTTRVVVGSGQARPGVGAAGPENLPVEILVPSGGRLRIDAQRNVDEAASFTARFIALRTPPVKRFDIRAPDEFSSP